jgi:deoxycytidylate deaminase
MQPEDSQLIPSDPFSKLPMEFRIPRSAFVDHTSQEVHAQRIALIRAARERGLNVEEWEDHSVCERCFRISLANV